MRKTAIVFVVLAGLVFPAHAKILRQEKQVQEQASLKGYETVEQMVDELVEKMDFQFQPATLNGQVNGVYGFSLYEYTIDFPLWLMMNMNGPLLINEDLFSINSKKKEMKAGEWIWRIDASCMDEVNGFFALHVIIEAKSGKAMVNVLPGGVERDENQDPITTYLYDGYVYPGELSYLYKSPREERKALQTEQVLDSIVPRLNFRIGSSVITPKLLEESYARLLCCEKVSGKWYLRFVYPPEKNLYQKVFLTDIVVDSRNGEGYRRDAYYDYLPKNWQHHRNQIQYVNPN